MALYFQNLKRPINGAYTMSTRMSSMLSDNMNGKLSVENAKDLHVSSKQEYPQAELLPLPLNIDPTEATRFSPQRARDITSTVISTSIWNQRHIDITVDATPNDTNTGFDPHVDSYDCQNAVSLNSAMQSNVPSPFSGTNTHYMHLNMPGGQWSQHNKWMSHGLNASHYINLRLEARKKWNNSVTDDSLLKALLKLSHITNTSFACMSQKKSMQLLFNQTNATANLVAVRTYATAQKDIVKSDDEKKSDGSVAVIANETKTSDEKPAEQRTIAEKLKTAIKDYGGTVLVFHISLSLLSLGFFYQLVSSGIDIVAALEYLGYNKEGSSLTNNVTSGAGTFVVAYSIHKLFAPIRISITLAAAPFIVRFLRARGILSKPPIKP